MTETYEEVIAALKQDVSEDLHESLEKVLPREHYEALKDLGEYYDNRLRDQLEKECLGQWAVVSDKKLIGVYKTSPQAAAVAMPLLRKQTCLIRHIGYVLGQGPRDGQLIHVPVRHP